MELLKEKSKLSNNTSLAEFQDALVELGFKKVNNIMRTLGLNPWGRKAQDAFEVGKAIGKGKITLSDAINAYNTEIKAINDRREKVKEFFTKENIEDLFDNLSEWIQFAFSLWNSRIK